MALSPSPPPSHKAWLSLIAERGATHEHYKIQSFRKRIEGKEKLPVQVSSPSSSLLPACMNRERQRLLLTLICATCAQDTCSCIGLARLRRRREGEKPSSVSPSAGHRGDHKHQFSFPSASLSLAHHAHLSGLGWVECVGLFHFRFLRRTYIMAEWRRKRRCKSQASSSSSSFSSFLCSGIGDAPTLAASALICVPCLLYPPSSRTSMHGTGIHAFHGRKGKEGGRVVGIRAHHLLLLLLLLRVFYIMPDSP